MSSTEKLLAAENNWQTSMGRWFAGERVVIRGKDLFTELKDMRWMELMLFSITGRHFSENELKLLEGMWVLCTSYPDPRLWNNRVASLAGTVRSTPTLALSGANSLSEAEIYGRKPDVRTYDFLVRCQETLKSTDACLEDIIRQELKTHRVIPGYGRPIISKDERIKPMTELSIKLGVFDKPYIKLAHTIENALSEGRWRMKMNIAAFTAALALDLGLSRNEYLRYAALSFSSGLLSCYIDANDQALGTFLPIRCSKISYEGKNVRNW
ncbi:MAG: hypothetical protein GXP21_06480 [Gammaproteobacteria bacterium]|nr:hypothetical protein [Gammaproteobacteria bacterium]